MITRDVNAESQDASSERDKPSVEEQQLSTATPEVFTREQVEELVRQRHSTLDKRIAKLEKELLEARKVKAEADRLRETLAQMEKEREENELKSAEGNPELLDLVRQRQALRRREQEIDAKFAEFNEYFETASALMREKMASELAKEFNISVDALLEFESETPEQMRVIAEKLAKIAGLKPETKSEARPSMKPESGVSSGPSLSFKRIEQAYAEGKITTAEYLAALKEHGKI